MGRLGKKLIKSLREATREGKSTWEMYKDKPFFERLSKVLYTCDLLDPVFDVYYSIMTFIHNCQRVIEFIPLIWQHRNWDHGFVLKFNIKLYEDLYKGCFVEGHHVVNPKEARRLRVVIGLLKRIAEEEYVPWQYDYLENKYGPDKCYFKRIPGTENKPGGPYSRFGSRREDRLTDKQKIQYNKDRKRLWALEEYQMKQDLEMLGKYIAKYSRRWWD